MEFDWNEFIATAEDLSKLTSEGSHRSATSRAYYGAFNLARKRIEDLTGKLVNGGANSHDQLWTIYALTGTEYGSDICDFGSKVKLSRTKADYKDPVADFGKEYAVASARVTKILDLLKEVKKEDFASSAISVYLKARPKR